MTAGITLRILATLLSLVAALVAFDAEAADRELRLELRVPDEHVPTSVCIVTKSPPKASVSSGDAKVSSLEIGQLELHSAADDQSVLDDDKKRKPGWNEQDLYLHGLLDGGVPIPEPHKDLEPKPEGEECRYGKLGCRPVFSLRGIEQPERATMTCVKNKTESGTRALVLSLEAEHRGTFGPYLRDLRLDGKQLLVTIERVEDVGHLVQVLGGFYAPTGEARFPAKDPGRSIELEIEPRCRWTTIGIPKIAARTDTKISIELTVEDALQTTAAIETKDEPEDEKSRTARENEMLKCGSGTLQGTSIRLLIPYFPEGRKRLVLKPTKAAGDESSKKGEDEKPRWLLETSWYGARPLQEQGRDGRDARLMMGVTALSFAWRDDGCLHPGGGCPKAVISTSGAECQELNARPDEAKLCNYTCRSENNRQLDVPTTITFSRKAAPELRWAIDVHTIDQTLEGYVDPAERAFPLDINPDNPHGRKRKEGANKHRGRHAHEHRQDASKRERLRQAFCPAGRWHYDDIHAIEFTLANGTTQRVRIHDVLRCHDTPEQREAGYADATPTQSKTPEQVEPKDPPIIVKLPNVSCGEPIRYRYVGERRFDARSTQVESGKLGLEHPMASARRLHYAVAFYPASFPVVSSARDDLAFGRVQLAPMLTMSLVWKGSRDPLRGWRLAIDGTVIGSRQPFQRVGPLRDEPGPQDSRLYVRWLLGGSFLTPWLRTKGKGGVHPNNPVRVAPAFGAGMQVLGIGHPLLKRDFATLSPYRYVLSINADARLRLHDHVEASFSPRLLVGDEIVRYRTDFSGQPRRDSTPMGMVTLLLPVGLVFIW